MGNDIESIKNTVSIVEIVSQYVDLKADGSGRLKGLCPFHSEKTPSFIVNLSGKDEGTFHCFGCSVHGDIVDFIQAVEHLDGPGAAVRFIQERFAGGSPAGITRPAAGSARKAPRIERSETKAAGSSFSDIYAGLLSLLDDPQPDGYLTRERGVTVAALKRNGVKQISAARQQTIKKDMAELFPVDRLKACGLFPKNKDKSGCHFNFFHCDYVFTYHGQDGRPAYLQGVPSEQYRKERGKYINLKGIDKPFLFLPGDFTSWRPGDDLIITEGALDALSVIDLGLNAVAIPDTGKMKEATAADLEPLRPFKCRILGDNDIPGMFAKQALCKVMIESGYNARRESWKELCAGLGISKHVKDFNELLQGVRKSEA